MSKYIVCSIEVIGEVEDMERFYETLTRTNAVGKKVAFSFHQTVPLMPLSGGNPVTQWGTERDARNAIVAKQIPTKCVIRVEVTWPAPYIWGQRVSKLFPTLDLTIAYYHPALEMYGVWQICDQDRKVSAKDYMCIDGDLLEDSALPNPDCRLSRFLDKHYLLDNTE